MGLFEKFFGSNQPEKPTENVYKKETLGVEAGSYKSAVTPLNTLQKLSAEGYVRFGVDDTFYDNLIFLYNQSPIHRAIIDRKIDMILGAGYSYDIDKFNALTDDKKNVGK